MLGKIDFADFVKDAKSVAGYFLPANFESDGMVSHKHSWLLPINARHFQNMVAARVASFTNFFRIAG